MLMVVKCVLSFRRPASGGIIYDVGRSTSLTSGGDTKTTMTGSSVVVTIVPGQHSELSAGLFE